MGEGSERRASSVGPGASKAVIETAEPRRRHRLKDAASAGLDAKAGFIQIDVAAHQPRRAAAYSFLHHLTRRRRRYLMTFVKRRGFVVRRMLEVPMPLETPLGAPSSLDGGLADILIRLLRDAGGSVERDPFAARACLDRASALLESERSRIAFSYARQIAPRGQSLLAPWQVRRFITYVNDNLDRPIRIQELGQAVRLSGSYFSRAFKATFGMAPQDYIYTRRMNLACMLMLTTGDSLCQIALACGFADQGHFSRMFSRMFGQPPGAWRRDHRGVVARN